MKGFYCVHIWAVSLALISSVSWAGTNGPPRLVVGIGHTAGVSTTAFSQDGKVVVSGSADNTVRLWNANTGRELNTLVGHTNRVTSVAVSPNETMLASVSADGTVRIWDLATALESKKIVEQSETEISYVAFNPDGKYLITGELNHLRLWDIKTGLKLKEFKVPVAAVGISAISLSPDGKNIALGCLDGSVRILDISTGATKKLNYGHNGFVTAIKYSPNGRTLASGGTDKAVVLWDVKTNRKLNTLLGHKDVVNFVSFSPDGKALASTGSFDKSIRLWNVAFGKLNKIITTTDSFSNSILFNKNGTKFISGESDGTLRMWDIASGEELIRFAGKNIQATSIAFSPNGRTISTGMMDKTIRIWDTGAGRQTQTISAHAGPVSSLAYSPDGNTVASGSISIPLGSQDTSLHLWDVASGQKIKSLPGSNGSITSIAFNSDGKTIAAGSVDKILRLWDITAGLEIKQLLGHEGWLTSVAFTSKGDLVASASVDKTLRLWDVKTGQNIKTMTGVNGIKSTAFAPDGNTIISGDITDLHLWSVSTGHIQATFSGHRDWIDFVAFSPDGKTIVSGSNDTTLRLWSITTGQELQVISGHSKWIHAASFGPDGKTIISSSGDGTTKLWRTTDGKELATLVSFNDGTWVVTDPEGRFDTVDLESMPHLHWVMPDDPFTPVPLEAFMKDYYEPRLLARILAGETFKPVRTLTSLNRTQPEVKITSVVPDASNPSLVRVTVSAAGATKSYLQGEGTSSKEVPRSTAVHDLRLFRDGQVVAYADGILADYKSSAFGKTFTVRLPTAKAGKDVVFSAYAFNDDRVKSETVRSTYKAPALTSVAASGSSKGRAYVISMGVNQHENSAWNLGYAANDARAVAQRVSGDLRKGGQFAEVVPLVLVSDGQTQHASKAALRAVLARLAGKPVSPADEAALQGVAGGELLHKAHPDDLVLISFAGHGFADDVGQFYLVAQDTGAGTGKQITAALKTKSISSEELSLWLRDVDAGDMTMIVDACQSAASVQTEGFKPGPMGSRGLGQLSFDKGMRILAASQSDEFALEDQRLKHGLLTFSLINDGLEAFNADFEPKDSKVWLDEWLKYGVKRVPTLAEEVKIGTVKVANRGSERGVVRVDAPVQVTAAKGVKPAQQPALFDFAKKRQPVVLVGK